MARRIEVELTSSRDDGTWTWRAAGARQPKGELDGSLLYPGAKVGDVVKVEADFNLDGIDVTTVFPPKAARSRPEVLELVSRPLRDDELVTTTRSPRREGGRGDDRRGRPHRDGGARREGDGGPRREGGGRRQGGDRDRPRRDRPEVEARPKPKRLRPRRTHRDAVVAEVPEEYRPIAQRVLSGGIPEVRKALEEQNAAAKAEGKPELAPGPILAIAEDLLPRLRSAEWRDRADAALADLDELDLRDLRSVVVAADAGARDDETRSLAAQLREGLNRRVEADHSQWMSDLTEAVNEGRVVRALRLSSRPVKAGAPLPQELAATLAEAASAALAGDISQDRWATVLDAVAFSPVRGAITPAGVPADPSPELKEAVTKLADRVPHIAALFGIDPAEAARGRTRARRARTRKPDADRPAGPAQATTPAEPTAAAPQSEAAAGPATTVAGPEAAAEAVGQAHQAELGDATAPPSEAARAEPAADGPQAEAVPGIAPGADDSPIPEASGAAAEPVRSTTPDEAPTSGEAPAPDDVDATPAAPGAAPDEPSPGPEDEPAAGSSGGAEEATAHDDGPGSTEAQGGEAAPQGSDDLGLADADADQDRPAG